jgi:hypothetical protein
MVIFNAENPHYEAKAEKRFLKTRISGIKAS